MKGEKIFLNDIKNKAVSKTTKDVIEVLDNIVSKHIKSTEVGYAEKIVYDAYVPKQYKRRRDKGTEDNFSLIDVKNNMPHNIEVNSNTITLIVENNSDFNSKYKPKNSNVDLALFIEEGYGLKDKEYNKPRPFLTSTQKDESWKDVFFNEMRKKGHGK